MMSSALQMQGRFSAISDISSAYIEVSTNYIRPAINRMEKLSTIPKSEWEVKSQEFLTWCDTCVDQIDQVASETSRNVDIHMQNHITALQKRAIEAADDAAGD